MTTEPTLLGRVPREAIHRFDLPRLPAAVIEGFLVPELFQKKYK